MSKHKMSAGGTLEFLKQALSYKTVVAPPKYWLNTGSKRLNGVLGSPELGMAYGMLYLMAGETSSGKSALAAYLAGLAQKDGADIAWVDGENSFDRAHVKKQGLDCGQAIRDKDKQIIGFEKVAWFRPEYGYFGYKRKKVSKLKLADVEAAEDLFTRVEAWMKLRRQVRPKGRLVVVVDSTNSFSPEEEMVAGFTDSNMRTKVSPAVFLNALTKRWVNLAIHTNAIVIFISQLRDNPGKMFGNPKYVSGGNGLQYFSHCVVWMRRVAGGEITVNKKQVGTKGLISNRKNKVGGGSRERKKCGYVCHFFQKNWEFISKDKIKGEK